MLHLPELQALNERASHEGASRESPAHLADVAYGGDYYLRITKDGEEAFMGKTGPILHDATRVVGWDSDELTDLACMIDDLAATLSPDCTLQIIQRHPTPMKDSPYEDACRRLLASSADTPPLPPTPQPGT